MMYRLFFLLIFIIPFQMRIYKCFKELSLRFLVPHLSFPAAFEPYADLFPADFILVALLIGWGVKAWNFEHKVFLLFLGVAFLSLTSGPFASYGISYWRLAHFGLAALCLYFMPKAPTFRKIATIVMWSGVLECAIALPQYLSQHQLGLKFLGEKPLITRHYEGPGFGMPQKAVTAIDYMLHPSQEGGHVRRASGTFSHPNILGGFLVFSILMTAWVYECESRKKLTFALLVLQLVTLLTTYSRSALFALLGGIGVWMVMEGWQEKKVPRIWKPVSLGLTFALLLFFPQLFHRGGVVSYNATAAFADTTRVELHNTAVRMVQDRPWLGVGFNNYLLTATDSLAVHNIYLLLAVETGLIGLGLFLLFCGVVLYRGWQARSSREGRILTACFAAFLAIGCVDYYPLLEHPFRLIFFLVAGLLGRVAQVDPVPAEVAPRR